jgi:aminoglycoside phosphotransferase (APT) family kinase protein
VTDRVVLPSEAAARLARRLGLPRTPEVRRAWTGATSTVLVWEDRLTIKVPRPDAAAVASCLTHARMAAVARSLGVRVPEVVLVTEPDEILAVPVVVCTYLRGEPAGRGAGSAKVWTAVGEQLARLHRADAAAVPDGLRCFRQHAEVDPARLATTLGTAGVLGAAAVTQVCHLRDRLAPDVLPSESPVLCHGDMHAQNVVASGERYVGLLDLAGAGWLDPAWDFVGVPLVAVAPALEGYRRAAGPGVDLVPCIVWCRLQTALHQAQQSGDPEPARKALADVSVLLDLAR